MIKQPVLYRHFDAEGCLLYVGVSLTALIRVAGHKATSPWFLDIRKITIEPYESIQAAMNAEKLAITSEKPKYNKAHLVKNKPNHMENYRRKAEQILPGDTLYSVPEVKKQLPLTEIWLRNARKNGSGPPFVMAGRHAFYPKLGLIEWVKSCRVVPQ